MENIVIDGSVNSKGKPHLLFFVTEDWYFCSHRLSLAIAAHDAGYRVSVLTRVSEHGERIRAAGLELIPSPVQRSSLSLISELKALYALFRIYRAESPDIIHHVALKPVIYGSLVARLAGCRHVINALGGLGYVFAGNSSKARLLRPMITLALRFLLNRPGNHLILQNPDDYELLIKSNVLRSETTRIIRGAGVDLAIYKPLPMPSGPPLVVLASRMLWDKGIGEFIEAARELHRQGVGARFVLVGDIDTENPAAIPAEELNAWTEEGVVEWWGHRDDMPDIFSQASLVVLPSYREGLPKVLLEASASGRAIVATDVPGCREAVIDGDNGLLVPPRDARSLASAIKILLDDATRREAMGRRGRELAEAEFSVEAVIAQTLSLYQEVVTCHAS